MVHAVHEGGCMRAAMVIKGLRSQDPLFFCGAKPDGLTWRNISSARFHDVTATAPASADWLRSENPLP